MKPQKSVKVDLKFKKLFKFTHLNPLNQSEGTTDPTITVTTTITHVTYNK
ncbi:MAG: hypothetical protein ACTHNW_13625 [Mucilaginibacter sp.]